MGSGQSVRATHFQHPNRKAIDSLSDEIPESHRISISNKMVERLVEDAALPGRGTTAETTPLRGDYKDKIYMEKLKYMDESHSERCGLTVEDINALTARIEIRTANMVGVEPVCADCKERVINCYADNDQPGDLIKCWDTVGAFTRCVHEATEQRLRARTAREAREHERRERHVAHAREHALKDLVPEPVAQETT